MKRLEAQPTIAPSGRFCVFHCFIFSRKFSFISYEFERNLTKRKVPNNFVKIKGNVSPHLTINLDWRQQRGGDLMRL